MVWREMPLGSVTMSRGVPRADVMTMTKSYRPRIRIYEAKGSRGDFLGDVQRGKYESYMPYCHQLYFAAPKGMIPKSEIPPGCGLIQWNAETGWHVLKAPPVRACDVNREMLLACLMRGFEEGFEVRLLRDRVKWQDNHTLVPAAADLDYRIKSALNKSSQEKELLQQVQDLMNSYLGRETRSYHDAVLELDRLLNRKLRGIANVATAFELLEIVAGLVDGYGPLENWGARNRLSKIVESWEEGL